MGRNGNYLVLAVLASISLSLQAAPTWKKAATIPIVVEGAACNSTTDRIGLTSGNVILSCQSGAWKATASGDSRSQWLSSLGYARFPALVGAYTVVGAWAGVSAMYVNTGGGYLEYAWVSGNHYCQYYLTTGALRAIGGLGYCPPQLALDGRSVQF